MYTLGTISCYSVSSHSVHTHFHRKLQACILDISNCNILQELDGAYICGSAEVQATNNALSVCVFVCVYVHVCVYACVYVCVMCVCFVCVFCVYVCCVCVFVCSVQD